MVDELDSPETFGLDSTIKASKFIMGWVAQGFGINHGCWSG
jgi:hypothetical protein